jgi:cytochrome P450
VEILSNHTDEDEWVNPKEFIPERFDPEHEYFSKPGSGGKTRTQYSHLPFSLGMRRCPGQSFAMLQMKVILSHFLSHYEYEVSEELLARDDVGFAMASNIPLPFKITQKMTEEKA